MAVTILERVAVVETKVGEIQEYQAEIGAKVNALYEDMVGDRANRRFLNKIFAGIAGLVGFIATGFEIFGK